MSEVIVKPDWDNAYKKVALRGALWTSPVWAGILLNAAGIASGEVGALIGSLEGANSALSMIFMFGSSSCMFAGYAFSKRNLGVLDALKRALSSVIAVGTAYIIFACLAFAFATGESGPAWGSAFGLIGAGASFIAALIGAVARLFVNLLAGLLRRSVEPPPPPEN
jgi:hypothetical protein